MCTYTNMSTRPQPSSFPMTCMSHGPAPTPPPTPRPGMVIPLPPYCACGVGVMALRRPLYVSGGVWGPPRRPMWVWGWGRRVGSPRRLPCGCGVGQCHLYARNIGLLWISYVYIILHVNRGRGGLDVHRLELQRLQLQIFESQSLDLQSLNYAASNAEP